MRNREVEDLKTALDLALDRGWKPVKGIDTEFLNFEIGTTRIVFSFRQGDINVSLMESSVYGTIFNHDFAKSLFGEQPTRTPAYSDAMENWQFHLQKMVIEPDPIAYIGRFLDV